MNCDVQDDLLMEYALGLLADTRRHQIDRHLADGCDRCKLILVELNDTLGQLPLILDPVEPPECVEAELMRRICASRATMSTASDARWNPSRRRTAWSVALNICATLVIAMFSYHTIKFNFLLRGKEHSLAESLASTSDEGPDLGTRIPDDDQLFESPKLRFVEFQAESPRDDVEGHVVWDETSRQLHFFASRLDPLGADETYQLWFMTIDDQWLSPTELKVDESGIGTRVIDVSLPFGQIGRVVVTAETHGVRDRPRGRLVLSAELN